MESSENEYIKALCVIESCETIEQLRTAKRYVILLKHKWLFESRFIQNSKNSGNLNIKVQEKLREILYNDERLK